MRKSYIPGKRRPKRHHQSRKTALHSKRGVFSRYYENRSRYTPTGMPVLKRLRPWE